MNWKEKPTTFVNFLYPNRQNTEKKLVLFPFPSYSASEEHVSPNMMKNMQSIWKLNYWEVINSPLLAPLWKIQVKENQTLPFMPRRIRWHSASKTEKVATKEFVTFYLAHSLQKGFSFLYPFQFSNHDF